MIKWQLDVTAPMLRVKEDISRNWGLKVSLPTMLGINCSLIVFSFISMFSIVLGAILVRNESFS